MGILLQSSKNTSSFCMVMQLSCEYGKQTLSWTEKGFIHYILWECAKSNTESSKVIWRCIARSPREVIIKMNVSIQRHRSIWLSFLKWSGGEKWTRALVAHRASGVWVTAIRCHSSSWSLWNSNRSLLPKISNSMRLNAWSTELPAKLNSSLILC